MAVQQKLASTGLATGRPWKRHPDRVRRSHHRYEELTCAWKGHFLVGTDAAVVRPQDAVVVRCLGGLRWYRCLRCDAWFPQEPPTSPARPTVPDREEIQLPERGIFLRDKYVLRLIAVERGLHVFFYGLVAVVLFIIGRHHATFRHDYQEIMNDLSGGDPASVQVRGLLGHLKSFFSYSPAHVYFLAGAVALLAALEAVEMVGLWRARRWAEYLTFVATTLFIPFEIYELASSVSAFKIIVLLINLAVVSYLLFAKRLFGLRGGGKRERARHEQDSGWRLIETTTPPAPVLAGDGDE